MAMRNIDQEKLVYEILNLAKYRDLGLPEETIRDVVTYEFNTQKNLPAAEKSARKKIHNIIANYLGHPDYDGAKIHLEEAAASNDPVSVKNTCREILQTHVSTSERLPDIEMLYQKIFNITGKPATILDLACGLHPLAFPWMDLPSSTNYHAYDIVRPRVDMINHFFNTMGLLPLAETRDILVDPPTAEADVAFIFKEIHRFEQRKKDSSFQLYTALNAKRLVVSLPAQSIHSKHDFTQSYRNLFYKTLHNQRWPVTELLIGMEMFFIIEKSES